MEHPDLDPNADLIRRHDGAERVPLLPMAELIIVSPSSDPDQPPDVAIQWNPERLEQPIPGSALWRAVLERRLGAPPNPQDPADRVVRLQIERSLLRFPSLESWWSWLRSGWSAPPRVPPEPARPRRLGWWRRFRRG